MTTSTPRQRLRRAIAAVGAAAAVAFAFSHDTWTSAALRAQVRDTTRATTPAPGAVGTAAIDGVVTDDGGHQPLRRATVTVSSGDMPARVMSTDDNGHFQITGLPPGAYSATASKPGYVTTFVGSHRQGRAPALPFAIADGERKDLAITIVRGSVIAGIITDAFGQPVPAANVGVLEIRAVNGERRLVSAGASQAHTDERGAYRVWGLAAGTYFVSANPPPGQVNVAIRQITTADMDWAREQLSASRSGGPSAGAPDAGRNVAYAPVYFPGVVDAASAAELVVGPSEEHTGVNFALQLVPTATVEGTVVGPDGQLVASGIQVMLSQQDGRSGSGSGLVVAQLVSRGTSVDRTGKFSFAALAPGQYTITARGIPRPAAPPAPMMAGGLGPPPPPAPPTPLNGAGDQNVWATLDVSLAGDDVKGLVLSLRPGMTVSGRIVFEGTSAPVTDLRLVRVGLTPFTNDGVSFPVPQRTGSPGGTFALSGVTPGRYRIQANITNPPPAPGTSPTPFATSPWHLKSAIWEGHDLLDTALDVRPNEDVSGVTLIYSDLTTELSGSLMTGGGTPALGYVVVIFPTDSSLWEQNSRRVRQIQPQFDGKFKVTGLPPGSYNLGAVTDVDFSDLSDSSFLEQLAGASLTITLADGAKVVQNLRLK